VAATEACLARIDAREPEIHAWAWLDRPLALAQAKAADARRASGAVLGPPHGLPVGVKDIIDTADMPTQLGTVIHEGRRPAADATIVTRLREAGAVVIGKTVTSELAVYTAGPTRNPHDVSRTPGGSSSGSAAAVAAGMVPLALATQTNGSTIRPASFCGVVGYKPSLGLLPRGGVLKQSRALDQPGLIARDVEDVALLARALFGRDPEEMGSPWASTPALSFPPSNASPSRLGFIRPPEWDRIEPAARAALETWLKGLGGLVETVALPYEFADAVRIHATIMHADLAQAYHNDHERAGDLMSARLRGLIELGRATSAVDYVEALEAREQLRLAFRRVAAPFDALITPATLGIAPKFEQGTGDPSLATPWTLLAAPALTLPLLTGDEGMPVGVQLVGAPFSDDRMLRAALWLERRA
jgi:Asp-tRNA(Asn)/Glu-tRNA(Gln) amidotransferase A subunit family amidase